MPVEQSSEPIYINRFVSGLYTNRSPLVTPYSTVGLNTITRMDSLIDGLNVELTPQSTLARRPGTLPFQINPLSSSQVVRNAVALSHTTVVKPLLNDRVAFDVGDSIQMCFDGETGFETIFSGLTGDVTTFQVVNDILYYANGTIARKFRWSSLDSIIGIATPILSVGLSFGVGALTFTTGVQYAYSFKSSLSGHVSTASPISANTGPQTSKSITLSGGSNSSDPQVDLIVIWRTEDGGSTLFKVAEIANTPGWTFADSIPDSSLNTDETAPIDDANDPPPTGITNLCFHVGRMWGSVGNAVYFAGGPDTVVGVPEEAWPPANVFLFPYRVQRLQSTPSGLLVFTTSAVYMIVGTDLLSFAPQQVMANFGIQNYLAVGMDSDAVYVFTSSGQLWAITSTSIEEIGFPINDILSTFDPTKVVVSPHRSGTDAALFVSNGVDTVMRYDLQNASWSPKAVMTGGVGYIGSQEIMAGVFRLLVAPPTVSGFIQKRDLVTFSDKGTSYSAFATIGSLVIAPPGAKIFVDAVLLERMPVGSEISVGVLTDEISGSFTDLGTGVPDPPELPQSSSVITLRHDLQMAALPLTSLLRHLQIKLTFATEAVKNEVLGIALTPHA